MRRAVTKSAKGYDLEAKEQGIRGIWDEGGDED